MSDLAFRYARESDLPVLVEMLADDDIAENREACAETLPEAYASAFAEMQKQPGNHILVAEDAGEVVGSLQLVFIPSLSRQGTKRALIESVRVIRALRGKATGTALMKEAIRLAREAGCGMIQLTSDNRRHRAHLFYRRLGFQQSHEGFKKDLK